MRPTRLPVPPPGQGFQVSDQYTLLSSKRQCATLNAPACRQSQIYQFRNLGIPETIISKGRQTYVKRSNIT
ncbi:MAG: hypothetical protein AAFO69_21485, partial [Bacteroidota bacterium]